MLTLPSESPNATILAQGYPRFTPWMSYSKGVFDEITQQRAPTSNDWTVLGGKLKCTCGNDMTLKRRTLPDDVEKEEKSIK